MDKTAFINGVDYKRVKVRKDLLDKELSVPIGKIYYSSSEPLPYRWKDDEEFQVFYKGKWQEAASIDWEFED